MVIPQNKPYFSILLPTHNRDDVVGLSIESVLSQTFTDFELLIVGDGCTDSTESIVKEFVKKDKRVKWFPFPKGPGFGYAHRNTVLSTATGTYSAFAAHDNLWFPDHLELFANFFEKNAEYRIAYSRPLWMHPDGTLIPSCFNLGNEKSRKVFFERRNEIPAHCVVHTRASGEQVRYYDLNIPIAGDWDLWKRIIALDDERRIGFISIPSAIHFKASWRTEKNYMNEVLTATYSQINKSPEFSKKLLVQAFDGASLQKIVWLDKLNKGGWVEEIRQHTTAFLDFQVGEATELLPKVATVLEENRYLNNYIRVMETTRGYKALEIFRKLVRPFRKVN